MLFFDPPSAKQIPSDITPSRLEKIPKHITEINKTIQEYDRIIADFENNKEWWRRSISSSFVTDDMKKLYNEQIKEIDNKINILKNYKTKLNSYKIRLDYIKNKNSLVYIEYKNSLVGNLRKLKKDMLSELSKPLKPVKRTTKRGKRTTKRGKRTKRR